MRADEPRSDALSEKFLDVFLYAPIGLVLDSEALAPDLATRGRQHRAAARQIGELAVKRGLRRIEDALDQCQTEQSHSRNDPASVDEGLEGSDTTQPAPANLKPDSPTTDDLAIPEYDLLAASQVVKRLGALSEGELEAVRTYETATRGRRTILAKIARLQM